MSLLSSIPLKLRASFHVALWSTTMGLIGHCTLDSPPASTNAAPQNKLVQPGAVATHASLLFLKACENDGQMRRFSLSSCGSANVKHDETDLIMSVAHCFTNKDGDIDVERAWAFDDTSTVRQFVLSERARSCGLNEQTVRSFEQDIESIVAQRKAVALPLDPGHMFLPDASGPQWNESVAHDIVMVKVDLPWEVPPLKIGRYPANRSEALLTSAGLRECTEQVKVNFGPDHEQVRWWRNNRHADTYSPEESQILTRFESHTQAGTLIADALAYQSSRAEALSTSGSARTARLYETYASQVAIRDITFAAYPASHGVDPCGGDSGAPWSQHSTAIVSLHARSGIVSAQTGLPVDKVLQLTKRVRDSYDEDAGEYQPRLSEEAIDDFKQVAIGTWATATGPYLGSKQSCQLFCDAGLEPPDICSEHASLPCLNAVQRERPRNPQAVTITE